MGLSRDAQIPGEAAGHVLHEIQDREKYVIGGCVEDLWVAVTALLRVCPQVAGHVGYLGGSFGGGIGAMACAWDNRIARAHLGVPSFGNQPLRAKLGSVGSAASVQGFLRKHPEAAATLAYHDAAVAARFVRIPVHCGCALFDPAVAPAGQFSVTNELAGPKELFVLSAGHFFHAGQAEEERRSLRDVHDFFRDI
jgi:cephalosporin-C deacetylase